MTADENPQGFDARLNGFDPRINVFNARVKGKSGETGCNRKAVLVGLPNSGKSSIFNNLTGRYTVVANYPCSTMGLERGRIVIDDCSYEVVDAPGVHSLLSSSEEDVLVREMIFAEKPDVLLMCMDANLFKQSLGLLAEVLELKIPMVVVLNAIDETSKKGIWIDSAALSAALGVPVIESIAIKSVGTNRLKAAMAKARTANVNLSYGDMLESASASITNLLPSETNYARMISLLVVSGDATIGKYLKKIAGPDLAAKIAETADAGVSGFNKKTPIRTIISKRSEWVDHVHGRVVKSQRAAAGDIAERIARACRSVVTGIPILMGIIALTYLLVVHVADAMSSWMNNVLWLPVKLWLESVITIPLLSEFLIGQYGVLSLGVVNALLTVLPILSVFFVAFNLIEDVGYIPNLSVLSRRFFSRLGISGAAIMPMVLGFGCKTMGTLTTKNLHSRREQYITTFLIAFAIPCAPQIALNMSMLGRIGIKAFIISFGVLTFVELAAGVILNLVLEKEEKTVFMQSLPPIRMPSILAVLKKTYYRMFWFLNEALPVFIYAAASLFVLSKTGMLDILKKILAPVVGGFMGLPPDMVDALILVMARREAAAGVILHLVDAGKLDFVQSIVAVTLSTMFVPCFAHLGVMIKHMGLKSALIMAGIITFVSILIAGAMNLVMRMLIG
jgi:ferrous iron transport protein B